MDCEFDVLYRSGLLLSLQKGREEEALSFFHRALAVRLDAPEPIEEVCKILISLDRREEEKDHIRKHLSYIATDFDALLRIGDSLRARGREEEALTLYRQCFVVNPDRTELFDRLRDVFDEPMEREDSERLDGFEPIRIARRLCRLFMSGKGSVSFRSAFKESYRYRDVLSKTALLELLEPERCGDLLTKAETLNVIGELLQKNLNYEESIVIYRQSLFIDSGQAITFNNLGCALCDIGEYEEGLSCFEKALTEDPNCFEAEFGRAVYLLLLGRHREGWAAYPAYRKVFSHETYSDLRGVSWEGEDLEGKTILLLPQQGIGDMIQYIRYVPLFKEKGAEKVLLGCFNELRNLFSSVPHIDIVFGPIRSLPPYDYYYFLPDAPFVFGGLPEEIPRNVPYIRSDPFLQKRWSERISGLRGIKIGVVWAGNPAHRKDAFRSIDPVLFIDLLQTADCSFVGLQKGGEGSFSSPFLIDWTEELVDFADTAALISHLDYVITVDTAVAHLAGAMGKPVWILLPYVPDWRWMLHRTDSPWYPTARLFRQKTPGDWPSVLREVGQAIQLVLEGNI